MLFLIKVKEAVPYGNRLFGCSLVALQVKNLCSFAVRAVGCGDDELQLVGVGCLEVVCCPISSRESCAEPHVVVRIIVWTLAKKVSCRVEYSAKVCGKGIDATVFGPEQARWCRETDAHGIATAPIVLVDRDLEVGEDYSPRSAVVARVRVLAHVRGVRSLRIDEGGVRRGLGRRRRRGGRRVVASVSAAAASASYRRRGREDRDEKDQLFHLLFLSFSRF